MIRSTGLVNFSLAFFFFSLALMIGILPVYLPFEKYFNFKPCFKVAGTSCHYFPALTYTLADQYFHSLSVDIPITKPKKLVNMAEQVMVVFSTQWVTLATV